MRSFTFCKKYGISADRFKILARKGVLKEGVHFEKRETLHTTSLFVYVEKAEDIFKIFKEYENKHLYIV